MSTESPWSTDLNATINGTMSTTQGDVWGSKNNLDLGKDELLKDFVEFQVAVAIDNYYVPVCSCLGILGNMWSFVTLLSPALRRSTTCQYMAAIAIADSMILLYNILFLIRKFPGYEIFNPWSCRLLFFLFYFTIHFDVAVMVAMTFEKYMAVRFPLHAASWKPRTKLIMCIIAICTCALDAHNFFTRGMVYDPNTQTETCYPTGPENEYFLFQIWPWIDACVYCFIPLTSLFVMNILIIVWLNRSEKIRQGMGNVQMSVRFAPTKPASSSASTGSTSSGEIGKSQEVDLAKRNRNREGQITRMLLLVSFTFLLLVGPMAVLIIVERQFDLVSTPHQAAIYHLVRTVINNLMYTNHSLNFLLYCFSAKRFRQASLATLCFCRRDMRHARRGTTLPLKSTATRSVSVSSITT